MKKAIVLLAILIKCNNQASSQTCDELVIDGFYTSCFSNKSNNIGAIYVTYKLSFDNNKPKVNANGDTITYLIYNCVPKFKNISKAVKDAYESTIKNLSKTDSLIIITGSIYGDQKKSIAPDYCWTIVQSLSSKLIYYCFIIKNDDKCEFVNLSTSELQSILKYTLPIKK